MTMRVTAAGFFILLAAGCGGNEAGSCPTECPPCYTCFYGACVPDQECEDAGSEGDAAPDTTEGDDVPPEDDALGESEPPPDVGPDWLPDVIPDVVPDVAPPDVIPDCPPDLPPDVRPDVRPDVILETETREDADVRPDTDVTTARNTGEPCSSAAECRGPGAECVTVLPHPFGSGTWTWPGGYCTSDCGADGTCGEGAYCADGSWLGLPEMCTKTCASEGDCREDYICSTYYMFPVSFCGPPL